jgi:hypothetical protein
MRFSSRPLLALLMFLPAIALAEEIALFTVDVKLSGTGVDDLVVKLECESETPFSLEFPVPVDSSRSYTAPVPAGSGTRCSITTAPLPGHQLRFLGDGGSRFEADGPGCTFTGVMRGHSNFCQIQVENQDTSLTVFKHWIGTSENEDDVTVFLDCGDDGSYEPRPVNSDRPVTWDLTVNDANGFLCGVSEPSDDSFIADTSDCQELLILPGAREECTVVNTKVVKMIEMLNRYGLFIMIGVFMVVGGLAARKVIG